MPDLSEVHTVNLLLLAGGVVVLVSAYFRALLRRWCLTLPMLAVALGVLAGRAGVRALDPATWPIDPLRVLEQAARFAIALSLMHIAIHLPPDYLRRRWRAVAVLLLGGMALMWGLSVAAGAIALTTFGGLGLAGVGLVAACVTPTDPVLAGTVVTGKAARANIPSRLRHLIYAESAANDGLAYLLAFLPLLPLAEASWDHWILITLGYEVVFATLLGLAIGVAAIYYATFAGRKLGEGAAYAWELTSLVVLASLILHGVTAYPLSRLLGRSLGRA